MTIEELKYLHEKEDKVEYKAAKGGNYSFNGGNKSLPKERRHCILGYVTAFANEGGGRIVFGMNDKYPHEVVGTNQSLHAIGHLKEDIYKEQRIRVEVDELYDEENRRVLVIKVPGRPFGKTFKFEDVPLMRIGEELLPMSDEQYRNIVSEQEPDFSAIVCEGLVVEDLDDNAINKMKEAYARKQENPLFLTQDKLQVLNDLDLYVGNKLTYAALILLGKKEAIKKFLPQSALFLEYRSSESLIRFEKREFYQDPYFILADKLWNAINARNGNAPVQQGPYIFDIPYFNKEVIREAVNNAFSHRDYRRASEVVIKQYPFSLIIINPGGFPLGVNLKNLITTSSTPRNRLLAGVLAKTGIVERSGQGVDKIYYQCISEAKDAPDYRDSDNFQVTLKISGIVKDKAFALFINQVQSEREENEKLGVFDIITLDKIRKNIDKADLDPERVQKFFSEGLIEKVGKTRSQYYRLSKRYYKFTNQEGNYSKNNPIEDSQLIMLVVNHLTEFSEAKMGDFEQLLDNFQTREQVKYTIYKFVDSKILDKVGKGTATKYKINRAFVEKQKLYDRAMKLGIEEMKKRGEFSNEKTSDHNIDSSSS